MRSRCPPRSRPSCPWSCPAAAGEAGNCLLYAVVAGITGAIDGAPARHVLDCDACAMRHLFQHLLDDARLTGDEQQVRVDRLKGGRSGGCDGYGVVAP